MCQEIMTMKEFLEMKKIMEERKIKIPVIETAKEAREMTEKDLLGKEWHIGDEYFLFYAR